MKRTSTDPSQRRSSHRTHTPSDGSPAHATSRSASGNPALIDQLDRIVTPMHAIAVVDALQPDELTSHPDMPFALIDRLLTVTQHDPGLQQRLAGQLLQLAALATHAQHAQDAVQQSLETLAPQLLQPGTQVHETVIVLDEPPLPPLPEGQLVALHPVTSDVPEHLRAPARTQTLDPTVAVPYGWPKELTHGIVDSNVPGVFLERLTPLEDIESMAKAWPGRSLVRVNHRFHAQYQPTLSALRWHHALIDRTVYWEFDEESRAHRMYPDTARKAQAALENGVTVLVEQLEHQPPAAFGPDNTQALLFTHPAGVLDLYQRLVARWDARGDTPLPRHLDLAKLPEHALFVALTMLDHGGDTLPLLIVDIEASLPRFTPEVQARVLAALWIHHRTLYPETADQLLLQLKKLNCPESESLLDLLATLVLSASTTDDEAALRVRLLNALERWPAGTAVHAALLQSLVLHHKHRPFDGHERERLIQALSNHLHALLSLAHPHAMTPAVAIELERLDTRLLIPILLRWHPADLVLLLNAMAGGDGTIFTLILRHPDPADAAALRAALEHLLTLPGLNFGARGLIEGILMS